VIRWIATLEETPGWPEPCAWIVARDGPDARFAATPRPEDLADAAAGRSGDGGAGRLWRRRLARALAARWLAAAPEAVAFEREPSGRVRLTAPKPGGVSAGSRGGWAVVAVATDVVGVDLELKGGDAPAPLTPPEADLRRWTATEAWAKATGCSLDEAWASAAAGWPGMSITHLETAEFVAAAALPERPA
jgi:hypothetical protein